MRRIARSSSVCYRSSSDYTERTVNPVYEPHKTFSKWLRDSGLPLQTLVHMGFKSSRAKNTSSSKTLLAFSVFFFFFAHNSVYLAIGNFVVMYWTSVKINDLFTLISIAFLLFRNRLKEGSFSFSPACCLTSRLFEDGLCNILQGFLCHVLSDQWWQKVHESVPTQANTFTVHKHLFSLLRSFHFVNIRAIYLLLYVVQVVQDKVKFSCM